MSAEERTQLALAAFDARRLHGETSHEYHRALRALGWQPRKRGPGHCSRCGKSNHNRATCQEGDE